MKSIPSDSAKRNALRHPLFAIALSLVVVFCFSLRPAGGQLPDDAHWFYDYGGPSGDPFSLAHSENYLYMAGGFLSVNGSNALKNLARFNLNTETWEQVPGIGANHANFVRDVDAGSGGAIWVAGDFSSIGGAPASRVAKFDPSTGSWSALIDSTAGPDATGPASGSAYAVVRAGSYVYVGGFLFESDNPAMRYIRRFHLDTQKWEAVGAGLDDTVRDLVVGPDGFVYAAGAFTGAVARWDGSQWQTIGQGLGNSGTVRVLAFGEDDSLVAGGDFVTDGISMVATWDGQAWHGMNGGFTGGGDVFGVWALAHDAEGRVFAGGDFSGDETGEISLNKVAVFSGGAWGPLGSGLGNTGSQIVSAAVAVGNDVYFGGVFAEPSGSANAKKNFARWNGGEDFSGYQPASGGVVLQEEERLPVTGDKHWFLDYGGPSTDPYASAIIGDYLYLGGGFLSTAGNDQLKNLARFHLRYERWEQVPGIDRNHANFIRALHADDDGDLWVAGDFSRIGGVEAHRVAKFDPQSNAWSPLRDASAEDPTGPRGGGAYAVVRSGDYVYVGGFGFDSEDTGQRYIRRFNIETNTWSAVGDGLNGPVLAMTVDTNGDVYVSGGFNATGSGLVKMSGLARWDGSSWSEVGFGSNGSIRALRFGEDGRLYVGGQFSFVGLQEANNVAAWDGANWDPLDGGVIGGGSVGGIYGLDVDRVGRVYVSGDFSFASDFVTRLNKVAVFTDSGQWGALGSGLGNSSSQIVNTVIAQGEDVYFGGVFADANGSPNRKKNFARWNPNNDFRDHIPSEDAPSIAGETNEPHPDDVHYFLDYGGPSTEPFSFARQGDYLYMGGAFLTTDGNSNLKNLARFDLLRERWVQMPGIDFRQANFIRSLHADDEGNVWVAGDFSSIGGISASKVAKFDPTTGRWSALRDITARVDRLGPSAGSAYAVVRAGDYVYIGGFIFNSDDPTKRFVRRFQLSTGKWESVGQGLNDRVSSLAVDSAGHVYAGGAFTASGETPLSGLARWDGSQWTDVGSGVDGIIRTMAFGQSGKLYVGGQFRRAGSIAASNVAAWDGTGWDAMDGGVFGGGDVNGVFSISVDGFDRVYIGGDFDAGSGQALNKVGIYENGTWNALGSGLGNSTTQIVTAVLADGEEVYFGGVFADPNGSPNRKKNFARWNAGIDFTDYVAGLNAPPEEPSGPPEDELAEANKHMFFEYGGPEGGDSYDMVRHGDYIYLGGGFQNVSKAPGLKTLVRFNVVTETWETLPGLTNNQGWVHSFDLDDEGNLWVSGQFSSIGGVPARRIAKFHIASGEWSALRDRNHPDEFGPVSGSAFATVRAGDYVYIGGFIFNSDDPAERYIRRFNLTTNTWETVGNGLNGRVNALAVDDEGNVFAGGSFSASGTTPLASLARWDGERWHPVGGGVEGSVRCLKFDVDGTLYVAGTFFQVGGQLANMVAAWDGTAWDDLNLGVAGGSADGVWQIDIDSAGRIYIGGDFAESYYDGTRLNKVA
ncbi:MAG: hypothetical protein AAF514_07950, partial [Verrucomicrobiota bacterium]